MFRLLAKPFLGGLSATLAVVTLALVPSSGPAVAAAVWLPTTILSEHGANASEPGLAVDTAGNATAVWHRQNGSVQAGFRPAGGSWGPPIDIAPEGQSEDPTHVGVDGNGTVTAVWTSHDGTFLRVRAAERRLGGSWSAPTTLSAAGHHARAPHLTVSMSGTATVVWHRSDGAHDRIEAVSRPAGGSWGSPVLLSAAGQSASWPRVAVDLAGAVTAVWQRFDGSHVRVQAARRTAAGSWSAPTTLSATGQHAELPQVVVDAAGNATSAWYRSDGAHLRVQAAQRPVGGSWGTPVDLSAAGGGAWQPRLATDSAGVVTAAWLRSDGAHERVQVARRVPGEDWSAAVTLSAAGRDAFSPRLGADAAGNVLAVWALAEEPNGNRLQSARRASGGSWSAPVDLSGGTEHAVSPAQISVDGQGNHTVVWEGHDDSHSRVRARLLDTAAPVTRMLQPSTSHRAALALPVSWAATDQGGSGVASHDVRVATARWNGTFGTATTWRLETTTTSGSYAALAGATYCFSARSRDQANQLGGFSAVRCTTTPLDDRTIVSGAGWTRRSGSAYFAGTYTSAAASGATLTRTGVKARTLALLVAKGPGNGSIEVRFNGVRLGTYYLHASTNRTKVVLPVKTFATTRSGTLTIKVVSSGKPVRIDGVFVGK